MNTKVFLLLAMAALAAADFSYGRPDSRSFESFESYESDEFTRPKYEFQWAVRDASSGNDFDHKEARDGEDTQGAYSVHPP
ncbi:cuticle protein 8-like [Scylla paramamosain]|uniref:cuticle protein 8-like n=1 Tax=Scylla paramamosain TaxID=85552 RepID=UPI0030834CCA